MTDSQREQQLADALADILAELAAQLRKSHSAVALVHRTPSEAPQ
jgi:hypothetical protein